MLKRPLQYSCQAQLNVQIRTLKREHCSVHIKRNIRSSNELSIPSSIILGSYWENLQHIDLQPNLPVSYKIKSVLKASVFMAQLYCDRCLDIAV